MNNKSQTENCLYLKYLNNVGYGILNSMTVSQHALPSNQEGIKVIRSLFPLYKKIKKVEVRESEFKYQIKGTEIEQRLTLKRLENSGDIDLLDWIDQFRDAQEQCDWPSASLTTIAKSLLGPELRM